MRRAGKKNSGVSNWVSSKTDDAEGDNNDNNIIVTKYRLDNVAVAVFNSACRYTYPDDDFIQALKVKLLTANFPSLLSILAYELSRFLNLYDPPNSPIIEWTSWIL